MTTPPTSFRAASAASVGSSVVTAISLFVGIKLALEYAGASLFGAWALIQGIMIVSRVMDGGGTTNVVRRISIEQKNGSNQRNGAVIAAGLVLSGGPVVALSLLMLPPTYFIVAGHADVVESQGTIFAMLLASVANGVVSVIALTLLSSVEGMGLQLQRHAISIIGSLSFLVFCVLFVPVFGIIGYATAYVAMNSIHLVLALSVIITRRIAPHPPTFALLMEEIHTSWRTSFHLSGMALLRLSFEPLTKILLSTAAPLSYLALFDIALRITTQVRVVFQAMAQPLLAMGARDAAELAEPQRVIFGRVHVEVVRLTLIAAALQSAALPFASLFFFGNPTDFTFWSLFFVLMVGNSVNSFGLVGYFVLLSGSASRILLSIHLAMLFVNVAFGAVGIVLSSPIVIVLGYAATFCVGGVCSLLAWSRTGAGRLIEPLRSPDVWLGLLLCFASAAATTLSLVFRLDALAVAGIQCAALSIFAVMAARSTWSRLSDRSV